MAISSSRCSKGDFVRTVVISKDSTSSNTVKLQKGAGEERRYTDKLSPALLLKDSARGQPGSAQQKSAIRVHAVDQAIDPLNIFVQTPVQQQSRLIPRKQTYCNNHQHETMARPVLIPANLNEILSCSHGHEASHCLEGRYTQVPSRYQPGHQLSFKP